MMQRPYIADVKLEGIADILFHRYNPDAVQAKTDAVKGSRAKKTDDVETYVWRDRNNMLCLPGEYVRQAIIHAAKFRQDPRSPRKSAMDIIKAAVVPLTAMASLGTETWDYADRRRVRVGQSAITRTRPAFLAGWKVEMQFQVMLPEYVSPAFLNLLLFDAGRLIGVGDFRPGFGRFICTSFTTDIESA
jgi:hypothetical protein